ncbi:MAG TPA: ABC transporter permease [Candidatus Flavonifractor intestinipullorum]|uniref:ABC transporter permease n=1 Tax=Candidatus Flavonifractor intestinipullorum TaxID=2838587 RepID=A0A9D2S5U1_9FIRM|nr:ABC transporter permease [Candidatus Flavonifractor intestinipullorum]
MKGIKDLLRQKNFMFKLGVVLFFAWILVAIFAPIIAPHSPTEGDLAFQYLPPSADYWFGTDELGRDVFSRVLYASRVSLTASLVTVLISFGVGIFFGGLAGYIGGVVDDVMMRFSEMIQSFPPLILAMVIAAALGPNISNSILAMAVIWWPNYARLTRSIVISLKSNDYVTASRVLGATHTRILTREILPNSIGSLIVMCTLDLGNAILMFSGLSFLGLGVQPPTPEWGAMVSDGVRDTAKWWVSTFPGLAIFSVAIAANFIGDGLRDYLDPKMRRTNG